MEDYTLFLYAGFTNKKLDDLKTAAEFYRRAIKMQAEQLPAWQGLYEVITDEKYDEKVDDFALEVVEKLIQSR